MLIFLPLSAYFLEFSRNHSVIDVHRRMTSWVTSDRWEIRYRSRNAVVRLDQAACHNIAGAFERIFTTVGKQ